MNKIQLLDKIQKLSAIVHCNDLCNNVLTPESVKEIRRVLDQLTEEYIAAYC